MKRLVIILCLLSWAAWPQSMMIGVDRADVSGATYVGPGNVVSGANGFWSLRAYNTAYATGLGKLACISLPSTPTTCLDVSSDANGNFNIAAVGGLSTCNNSTVLCTVKTLYDQIGTACSGPCDATQATAANRPILVVPSGCTGLVGGLATRYCMTTTTGGAQSLLTPALGASMTQPFTLTAVYNNPVRTADAYLFNINSVVTFVSGLTGANKVGVNALGSNQTATANDAVFHGVQAVFNGASTDINVDGTSNTPGSPGGAATGTGTFNLLNFSGTQGFGGFSMEFGSWPSLAFSPTNSSNMSSNQHTYWGF